MRISRKRIRVTGTVQGVGFRPFVYKLSERLGLAGSVLNDSEGVLIEVQGPENSLDEFEAALTSEAPPLSTVESVSAETIEVEPQAKGFIIAPSRGGQADTPVSPDARVCADCLEEVRGDGRRAGYAFTNCTNCGPRFTITRSIPYDRPNTTMAVFRMCEDCAQEYHDPSDRRFHAQPIACPRCGPGLEMVDGSGAPLEGDPITLAAQLLDQGGVIAVKGLGGFHLACDATDAAAVSGLRMRKLRDEKPFAVMLPDEEWYSRCAHVDSGEEAALTSPAAPIVLVRRAEDSPLADNLAPGNRYVGLMLPYTPLHRLLLEAFGRPIVLTSGNLSDEPIAYLDDDADARLGPLVDGTLRHDREIHMRCDDSVVRVINGATYPIRRSRGYAPAPLSLAVALPVPILGAGPELKHTFCLGWGDSATLSQHIGDLENFEALRAFEDALTHLKGVFEVDPRTIAHDLHPDYLSTRWAQEQEGADLVGVQHHHAHIVSCLADNQRDERVIGLALDGTGYGDDGTLWGCEVLICDTADYERFGHLAYQPLPGGAAAIKQPWRMAAVYGAAAGLDADAGPLEGLAGEREKEWSIVLEMAERDVNSPATSSAGRLFDAVAAACGLRAEVSYEGQAAAELEQAAHPEEERSYGSFWGDDRKISGPALFAAVVDDLVRGEPVGRVAGAFHNSIADTLAQACRTARDEYGLATVALSGGTFQNILLLQKVTRLLEADGFEVLRHHRVPPNDGGIALGQVVIAGARSGE